MRILQYIFYRFLNKFVIDFLAKKLSGENILSQVFLVNTDIFSEHGFINS